MENYHARIEKILQDDLEENRRILSLTKQEGTQEQIRTLQMKINTKQNDLIMFQTFHKPSNKSNITLGKYIQ